MLFVQVSVVQRGTLGVERILIILACCQQTCCNLRVLVAVYTRKNAQLVTNLQQTCSKLVGTSLLQDFIRTACSLIVDKLLQACGRLATSLMNSTALLQVIPTTCYRAVSQQLVNKLWVTNLVQLDKITALLYNLLTSLLQACCEHILLTRCEIFTCVLHYHSLLLLTVEKNCTAKCSAYSHCAVDKNGKGCKCNPGYAGDGKTCTGNASIFSAPPLEL